MATNTSKQFKVNTLSKDLDIKLKDIAGVMKGTSYDVSAQAYLDGEAFDVFFNRLTQANQIVGIDDYISGASLPMQNAPAQEKNNEQDPSKKTEQPVKAEKVEAAEKADKKPAVQKVNQEKNKTEEAARNEKSAQPKSEPQNVTAPADKKNNQQKKKNDMSRFDRSNVVDTKKNQPQQKKTEAPRVEKKNAVKVGTNVNTSAPKNEVKSDKETVRVVDTRTASFDLSKYDDKLNDLDRKSVV